MRLACIERGDPRCHGKHGSVLETGMEHPRSKLHHSFGERPARESGPRTKNRCEGLPMDCRLVTARIIERQLYTPSPMRELRDLTRTRASLRQDHTSVANRMQKILEDANVKLA